MLSSCTVPNTYVAGRASLLSYTRRVPAQLPPQEPIVARCECGNGKARGARGCASCAALEAKPDTSGLDALILRVFELDEELPISDVYERLIYKYPRHAVAATMRKAVVAGVLKRRKISRTIGFVYSRVG